MSKAKTKNAQVAHSWGILLGMSAIPILGLMSKLYPSVDTLWAVLMVVAGVFIARSVVGYLFPATEAADRKKPNPTGAQVH
jgi:hypothetical protein